MSIYTSSDLGPVLAEAFKAGDFARAKQILEQLDTARPVNDEQRALLELLNSGALDRLDQEKAELRARWLATQIIVCTDKKDKISANRLALDLRELLMRQGAILDEELAIKVLKALRGVRAFEALARLGDRLLALGLQDPMIPKLVGQGLIDSGYPRAGLAILEGYLPSLPQDHPERLDGLGIAGRAHKQVYADAAVRPGHASPAPLRAAIQRSVTCYEDAYLTSRGRLQPRFSEWSYPAINLIAVLHRAGRDGLTVPSRVNAEDLARQILTEFSALADDKREPWDLATAGEAYLALNDWSNAEYWLHEYAKRKDVNAFALGGTLRQLEEVWKLDPKHEIQGRILYVLKAQLLAKDGGNILLTPEARAQLMSVQPQANSAANLEVFLSDGRPLPVGWFRQGLERTNSVGLVQRKSNKIGFGTGFLVRAGDFIPHMGDEPVFLTNAHVLSERPSELNDPHQPSVLPKHAVVEFTEAANGISRLSFEIDRILWDSPRSELDACLIAFKSPPDNIPVCAMSTRRPEVGKSRVIVIGHPGGEREMKLSLYESPVTSFSPKGLLSSGHDDQHHFLRYTNPTIGGNSGSPVFDIEDWCVIGLHHAGSAAEASDGAGGASGKPFGNEGIFIQSIMGAALRGQRSLVPAGVPSMERSGASEALPEAVLESVPSKPSAGAAPRGLSGKMVHDIPAQMLERRPITVTANISRMESEKLFSEMKSRPTASYDIIPTAAMTLALCSAEGAFEIVPLTPDTQWIDRRDATLDSVTTWKWTVKPLKTGTHELWLVLNGREARNGIEAALPAREQRFPVRIQVDTGARALTFTKWAAVAAGGGMVSWIGQLLLRSSL